MVSWSLKRCSCLPFFWSVCFIRAGMASSTLKRSKHPRELQKWVNAKEYGNKSIFVCNTKEETAFTTSYGLKTCFLSNWLSRMALLPESAILKEACARDKQMYVTWNTTRKLGRARASRSTMGNKIGYDFLRKQLTLLRFSPRCYNNNKEANQWQEPISIGSCCQWISDNACLFA